MQNDLKYGKIREICDINGYFAGKNWKKLRLENLVLYYNGAPWWGYPPWFTSLLGQISNHNVYSLEFQAAESWVC